MASNSQSVIVIGAGIAGLAAARELCDQGWRVIILESRTHFGGRIHTVCSDSVPFDLGAEFIHGRSKPLWELIHAAGLSTHEVPDKQWEADRDRTLHQHDFWGELAKVIEQIDISKPDQSFDEFARTVRALPHVKEVATDFVEGFNAARSDRISVHGLALSEKASDEIDGTSQFRIDQGYAALIDWLVCQLQEADVTLHLDSEVKVVRWKPGGVEVGFLQNGRPGTIRAVAAIITVPLGVLQAEAIEFQPELTMKSEVITNLDFGSVAKITLRFHRRFWPEANFGFIHSMDEWLPTWWSDPRGNVVTGWAGGPKGARLVTHSKEFILDRAIAALSVVFGEKPGIIRRLLLDAKSHNWTADPFARGAYSYIPVGMIEGPRILAEPVADTLFFAGEATSFNGRFGTVHGALETGLRAASELRSLIPVGLPLL